MVPAFLDWCWENAALKNKQTNIRIFLRVPGSCFYVHNMWCIPSLDRNRTGGQWLSQGRIRANPRRTQVPESWCRPWRSLKGSGGYAVNAGGNSKREITPYYSTQRTGSLPRQRKCYLTATGQEASLNTSVSSLMF